MFAESIVCLLLVLLGAQVSKAERLLSESDLAQKPYEELHRIAVLDQVRNHIPAQQSLATRWTKSLNGAYDFCFDDSATGFRDEFQEHNLRQVCRRASFRRMPVPSSFNDITSNSADKNYMGWFWYQTSFELPASAPVGQLHWHIQFESVNYLAVVWLKQVGSSARAQMLGSHVGGHLPFMFNVTHLLVESSASFGRRATNGLADQLGYRLTVAVSNMLTKDTIPSGRMEDLSAVVGKPFKRFEPDFDFFHFAGILGDINLIGLPPTHLSQVIYLGESVSTPIGLRFRVCVHRSAGGVGDGGDNELEDSHAQVRLSGVVLDSERRVLGELAETPFEWAAAAATAAPPTRTCSDVLIALSAAEPQRRRRAPEATLWAPLRTLSGGDVGHFSSLVRARFEVRANASGRNGTPQVDRVELRLGLRAPGAAQWIGGGGGGAGNGRRPMLRGFGMHHEEVFGGRTMGLAAIMKDMYLLKQSNANLIRTSHYPYSRAYLDQCDEHGIQVIAECPAVGLSSFSEIKLALHKQILLEMLERDHAHASIIMWSIANEPQSQLLESKRYFEALSDYVRMELAHYVRARPITAAIAQSYRDDKIAHTLDVIMVNNYYGWYEHLGVLEAIRRPLLGSLGGWARKHPDKMLVLAEHGAEALVGLHRSAGESFSEEYQRSLLLEYERVINRDILNCSGSGGGAAVAAKLGSAWPSLSSSSSPPPPQAEADAPPPAEQPQGANATAAAAARRPNRSINLVASMVWNFADFSTHQSLSRAGGNRKGVYSRTREPKLAARALAAAYGAECFV